MRAVSVFSFNSARKCFFFFFQSVKISNKWFELWFKHGGFRCSVHATVNVKCLQCSWQPGCSSPQLCSHDTPPSSGQPPPAFPPTSLCWLSADESSSVSSAGGAPIAPAVSPCLQNFDGNLETGDGNRRLKLSYRGRVCQAKHTRDDFSLFTLSPVYTPVFLGSRPQPARSLFFLSLSNIRLIQ